MLYSFDMVSYFFAPAREHPAVEDLPLNAGSARSVAG